MDHAILSVERVGKAFRGQQVLKEVSLHMEGGGIYGLVGRNGSGKTILMKMMCGYLAPDEGRILCGNTRIRCGKALPVPFGVVFDSSGFIPGMSGLQNLRLLAGIRNTISKSKVEQAIEQVGLNPRDKKRVGAYSLGMKQRLAIAQALMEDPAILLLDEPMNGLDAASIARTRTLLTSEKEKGKLIVVATHVEEDVRLLCDQVFRVSEGSVAPMV